MANNDTQIVFDSNSGISEAEQREILASINNIAEKNRQRLSGASPTQDIQAKKNGALLPVAVNVVAVFLLAGGFFLFSSFHGKQDVLIREGSRVYNSAERELINQIRKETSQLIEEKEKEIAGIVSVMDDIDSQLNELSSSNIALTAEQLATEKRLRQLHDEHRASLAALQEERSHILETSRSKEASLQAEYDARLKELAAVSQQKSDALDLVQSEFEKLSSEQEKAAAIEAQLGASFATANDQMNNRRLNEAAETLAGMRAFINAPAFQAIRSVQARKELYLQSISAMETLVAEAKRQQNVLAAMGGGEMEDLQNANAELEKTIADLNKQIANSNTRGTNTNQRVTQLEKDVETLKTEKTTLESAVAEKDQTIKAKESEVQELKEDKDSLETQLNSLRQALRAISE